MCSMWFENWWDCVLIYFCLFSSDCYTSWVSIFIVDLNSLLDSLVVECWLRVWEVPGSILSQGPRHTKDVIRMVPVVPLFGTQHKKGKYWLFLKNKDRTNNVIDKIWDRNPSKSEVIGRCGGDEKNKWPHRTDKK